ncbi:MAG: protein-tyrosine phosphatase family protein [Acidimicrobiales bacterium]|jgi:hypothetical protein
MTKGKWAAGLAPRHFTWVIKDRLGISERPGGFAPNHRKVRRQEEIIWLRVQGFTEIVSLLTSSHNLTAYDEHGVAWAHFPLPSTSDPRGPLSECYEHIERAICNNEKLLLHQDELGDRVMGVAAGYLLWSGRLSPAPRAVSLLEHVVGKQMGAAGREVVAAAASIKRDKRLDHSKSGDGSKE